jgi:hypothetical protein
LLGSEFQTVWIILPRPGGNGRKLAVISPDGDETGTELAKESERRTPDEEHRPLCHAELRGCSSTKGDVWGVVCLCRLNRLWRLGRLGSLSDWQTLENKRRSWGKQPFGGKPALSVAAVAGFLWAHKQLAFRLPFASWNVPSGKASNQCARLGSKTVSLAKIRSHGRHCFVLF